MNKKKVAVMTWYGYDNYGTALQVSALCNQIEQCGYEVNVVQYRPKGQIEDTSRGAIFRRILRKIGKIFNGYYTSRGKEDLFANYLNNAIVETSNCRTFPELHDLNAQYDAFVCGSDQIWSPLCFDDKYFLSFVDDTEKMVAYAPSIGATDIKNPIIKEKTAKLISRFTHLSIREQQGATLIKSLTGQDANVVLDPTLLMDGQSWDNLIQSDNMSGIEQGYILCYFLGDSDKYMSYVKTLSKKTSKPFYLIPVNTKQKRNKNAIPFEVGPKEFVTLVRNADYVCTDSFHGMAFSINYNIPFSVFKRFKEKDSKNQNSRIYSLLSILKLEQRLVNYKKKKDIDEVFSCDFTVANKLLASERNKSLEYLKTALDKATTDNKKTSLEYKITDLCCGCGACATICPKDAISIIKNDEGFEHYHIDALKCVRCGQCKSVCPMTNIIAPDMKESKALYAVKSESPSVLKRSSSGGIAHEIAKTLQSNGYYICGCAYDSELNQAKHIIVAPNELEKLSLLQGSKYIQSISSEALQHISTLIQNEKLVFFGTPCQVSAVDKMLSKKGLRQQAILVDLICHGVPTDYLWKKYLSSLNKRYNIGKNPTVLFRNKRKAWRRMEILVVGNGHEYKQEEHKDDFYAFFRRGLCYMKACSDCPYRERSAADLRIGDYWGPRFEQDKQGVSMVVVNSEKGHELLNVLSEQRICMMREHTLTEYWQVQSPYNQRRPLEREKLIDDLKDEKTSLHVLRKSYCGYYDRTERLMRILKRIKRICKRG